MKTLKILSGALDELIKDQIALRGSIDPASLPGLLIPAYQREAMHGQMADALLNALRTGSGRMADVELAVRGERYRCTSDDEGTYAIAGETYIIDGLQRIEAAKKFIAEGGRPALGAIVHFATTEEWERERFRILNMERRRISPNLHLRNKAAECPSLNRLVQLCFDKSFVLYDRVAWAQSVGPDHLLTALVFVQTAMRIHAEHGSGRSKRVQEIWEALPPMMETVGADIFIENVRTFFDLLDAAWGIRERKIKNRAIHLKSGFLFALADVISDYSEFWDGKALRVYRDTRKKIGQLDLENENIRALAISPSNVALLRSLMVTHINNGRRTRRLSVEEQYRGGTRCEVGA